MNPASVDYLYFVSKQNGTHYFSSSLAEHNLAVQRYINKKDEQTQELDYNQPHQIEENSLQKVEDEGSEQKD